MITQEEERENEFNLDLSSFIHHVPGPIGIWIINLIVKVVPIFLGVLSLYNNIISNFYYFDFAYNLTSTISNIITVLDWALDLQLIRPVKPWNRYDPHMVKPVHLHEQNQTGYTFTIPAPIRAIPLNMIPCTLLRYTWCDEYNKKLREVWVPDRGQDVTNYHENWHEE